MNAVKFSSGDWSKLTGVVVLDPDGWDRKAPNFDADWNKEIEFDEFWDKASNSTTRGMADREVMKESLGLM
jgi:hypothetical protein